MAKKSTNKLSDSVEEIENAKVEQEQQEEQNKSSVKSVEELTPKVTEGIEEPDEEGDEYEMADTQFPRFHTLTEGDTLEGIRFLEEYSHIVNEDPDDKDSWKALKFKLADGEEVLLNDWYQLRKAVEKYGKTHLYKITHRGTEAISKNQKVVVLSIMVKPIKKAS